MLGRYFFCCCFDVYFVQCFGLFRFFEWFWCLCWLYCFSGGLLLVFLSLIFIELIGLRLFLLVCWFLCVVFIFFFLRYFDCIDLRRVFNEIVKGSIGDNIKLYFCSLVGSLYGSIKFICLCFYFWKNIQDISIVINIVYVFKGKFFRFNICENSIKLLVFISVINCSFVDLLVKNFYLLKNYLEECVQFFFYVIQGI